MKLSKKKIIFSYFLALFFKLILFTESDAATEYSELNGKCFYIKKAYTGHYLDVDNGIGQNDINV